MDLIKVKTAQGISTIKLSRPKVNAINESLVDELIMSFSGLKNRSDVKSILLTGEGSFLSFGFDIPEFLNYSKDEFRVFVEKFCKLLNEIFLFPKPVLSGINGHAIAGGCLLALACDYRIMVEDRTKIALNELTFGSTVFPIGISILKYTVGTRNAEIMLERGGMYSANQAKEIGLIDKSAPLEKFDDLVEETLGEYSNKDPLAFSDLKYNLRKNVIERDNDFDINRFIDIWYSDNTWNNLQNIKIKD